MAAVEIKPVLEESASQNHRGYKYATVEDAKEAKRRMTKERNLLKKDEYNEYQREYQRKLREKKKFLEQQNAALIQQQQIMYQLLTKQNIVVTPNFILEILDS